MTQMKRLLFAAISTLLALACSSPNTPAEPEPSQGSESTLEEDVNTAHTNFKEEVRPAATELDRIANESVSEGKEAIRKLTGTDEEPK